MSHFLITVIVPRTNPDVQFENWEQAVEPLLAPYSENLSVEPYMTKCHCVGDKARGEARAKADEECGTIQSLRESFAQLPGMEEKSKRHNELEWSQRKLTDEEKAEYKVLDKEIDEAWKAHIKARVDAEQKHFDEHPDKDKPDPMCGRYDERWWTEERLIAARPEGVKLGDRYDDESGCGGTGEYETTYNPKSKWDWYSIGGRWNGWLADEDKQPENDPRNWETCWVCGGTGKRDDELGRKAREENPEYTCNGCNGTGKQLKWPTSQIPSDMNVVPVEMFLELERRRGELPTPRAFVTPDGEWYERGRMGMFGMSHGDIDPEDWDKQWRAAVEKFSDGQHVAVSVDCHI
jgi:hypothetical protein